MALVMHPQALMGRSQLHLYGAGYHAPMDFLLISAEAKRNTLLTQMYVACPTPSPAVDQLRHPYEERFIGVKYIAPVTLAIYFGYTRLPDPCPATFFSELANRWLAGHPNGIRALSHDKGEAAWRAHASGQEFAHAFGHLPAEVVASMQNALDMKQSEYANIN